MSISNNKRIAKNTIFLYVRMLLVMAVSIYTSRVVLATLGISDYGIYNVVGGIVAVLGFLNNSMSNAVQRFLSFELGQNDINKVNHVFCTAVIAHFAIALFVVVILESIGPWFIETQMTIPSDRLNAAHWVFQCSTITAFFSIMQVPYNAIVIAKEKMGIYAYISIIEVILQLCAVYLLLIIAYDKLVSYAILHALISISILLFYRIYCIQKFAETKFYIIKSFATLKEIGAFAIWNMIGEFAWSMTNQGISLLVNVFVGPVANAAQGLSTQVNTAVMRFVNNFQTALNPQIIKSYSSTELDTMTKLVSRGSRFSFFLLLMLSLPLIFEMDYILHLWLKEVPSDTKEFCQLSLICSLVMTVTNLLVQVIRATGNIRKYQFTSAFLLLLNFPMAWITLKIGLPPYSVVVNLIVLQFIVGLLRLFFVKKQVNFPIGKFITVDVAKMLSVLILSCVPLTLIQVIFSTGNTRFLLTLFLSFLTIGVTIFFWGLETTERKKIATMIMSKIVH